MIMASPNKSELHHTIMKFYESSLKVVLESRIPVFTSTSFHHGKCSEGKGSFCPCIERMEPWCNGIWEPMVIDVFFSQNRQEKSIGSKKIVHRTNVPESGHVYTGLKNLDSVDQPVLLERWTIQFSEFSSKRSMSELRSFSTGRMSSISNEQTNVFSPFDDLERMMTILLRSLYCTTRMVPAHSIFRLLCTSRQCNFTLNYRILSSPLPAPTNLKGMVHNCFTPMNSGIGCMFISVSYQPEVSNLIHKEAPLVLPRIISDYAAAMMQSTQNQDSSQSPVPSQKNYSSEEKFVITNIKVPEHGEKHAIMYPHAPETRSSVLSDVNSLECPFAIDEKYSSLERSPTCSSSISAGVAIGSLITMLRSSVPLGGNITRQQETEDLLLVGNLHKKTANDAIRELQMYIEFKDAIK